MYSEHKVASLINTGIQESSIYDTFINYAHTQYIDTAKSALGENSNNNNIFSWLSRKLTLHFVYVSSRSTSLKPIIFATYDQGVLHREYDAIALTNDYHLKKSTKASEVLAVLFKDNFFDFKATDIIEASIYFSLVRVIPTSFANSFVDAEYKTAVSELKTRSIELVDFNQTRIHQDLYDFEDLLEGINDKQFEAELLECIYAYNNQKFFVAATGLGAVLEHLLSLILEKHTMFDRNFPKDPTHKDYTNYMRKEPLSIDKRSKAFIDSLFIQRNAVSHFNKGFASKSICDQLMNGIKQLYDNYFLYGK